MRGARRPAEAVSTMRPLLRLACLVAVLLASAGLVRAGVSYDESAVFSFDTRDYLAGLAAESAVFTFDTRAADGLQGAAVSGNFAFDTRGATLPPLQISGVLRDSAGVSVAGATIQIKRAGAIFWQGVSGVAGAFTTPNLSGVNYTVIVTKPGYVTSISNLAGTAGGTQALNLWLSETPGALPVVTVNRAVVATAVRASVNLNDANAPVLKVFNGSQFVPYVSADDPLHTIVNPNRMTVVISHGWLSDPDSWARTLAFQIRSRLGANAPNLLAWDWRHQADRALIGASDVAAEQGPLLGAALLNALGTDYHQHAHFIGHSLGTLVNGYASNHVHGGFNRVSMNPSSHWTASVTRPHLTLLDEAEVASIGGSNVITSAELGWEVAQLNGLLIAGGVAAVVDWKSPIPKDHAFIDNYISAVGFHRPEAVNVCLLAPTLSLRIPPLGNLKERLVDAHGYSHLWYQNSVTPSATPALIGFGSALESGGMCPPVGLGTMAGDDWYENLNSSDPTDLTRNPRDLDAVGLLVANVNFPIALGLTVLPLAEEVAQIGYNGTVVPLDATGKAIMSGYESTIQFVGNVGANVIQKTGEVYSETSEKLGQLYDAARDATSSINPDALLPKLASVFKFRLRKSSSPLVLADGQKRPVTSQDSLSPSAWITVVVPADAAVMAFDFTVTGDPQEDKIACAINDQNVFTLPAKFAPDGQPVSTDMIDVSAYAGQSIELFFGLAGGTSTNCEVAIDGLRFITVPPPKIALAAAGANVAIKWPAAASGWVLESSDALVPANWQTVSTASGVTVDSGVATLEELMSGARKFYRLRRGP